MATFEPLQTPYDPAAPPTPWPTEPVRGAEAIRVLVLRGYGINCEDETAAGFAMVGATPEIVHVADVLERGVGALDGIDIVVFPGGFSFGDHIASGRVFANRMVGRLGDALHALVDRGGFVLGICNGFQTIVKMGLLPAVGGSTAQQATLMHNDRPGYYDGWVKLRFDPDSPCLFTRGAASVIEVPSRHGEGKLVLADDVAQAVHEQHLVPAFYVDDRGLPTEGWPDNPNGSAGGCAGLCDPTGRVFGLMPHPEAYLYPENHPDWVVQRDRAMCPPRGLGVGLLANGVRAALER